MSELTVPRAPVTVGRTATIRHESPGTGELAAAFGNRLLAFGTALEADRLDREMARLKVDMTRDLGELRLQVEDMGDPDAAGAAWDAGVASIRKNYLTGTGENGRPRVDKKNEGNFGLAFDDLTNTHALAIGRRGLALRQSQRAATYYDYGNVAAAQAVTADPETQAQLYADFDAETDRMVAAGTMSPEQGAVAKRDFRSKTENERAIRMQADDPQGLIEAIDSGDFANLDPETRARYGVSAQSEIDRRAAADQRANEAAAKERSAQIGEKLGTLIDLSDHGGKIAVDAAFLADPEVMAHPRYAEAQAALALRKEQPDLAMKTPAELDALIAAEKKRPVSEPWDEKRLAVLEAQRTKAEDGWRTDSIGFARQTGMAVPDLPEFDPANPTAYSNAIAARVTFAQGLEGAGYVKDAAILDREEQAALKKALSVEKDPAARAALAGTIVGAITARGGDPAQIEALQADPVLNWTGGMVASGAAPPSLAAEILSGQQAMEAKNLILPPPADRMEPTFAQLGTIMADLPGGEFRQAEITAAADALYAARVRRLDPTGAIDEDLYKQALHEVMGGTGTVGSRAAKGGLQDVNGALTILDPGTNAGEVEAAAMRLQRHMRVETGGAGASIIDKTETLPAASTSDAFRAMSRSGGLPVVLGEPLAEPDLSDAVFVSVGRDSYRMVLDGGAGPDVMDSQTGGPFIFSMRRLLREYGR